MVFDVFFLGNVCLKTLNESLRNLVSFFFFFSGAVTSQWSQSDPWRTTRRSPCLSGCFILLSTSVSKLLRLSELWHGGKSRHISSCRLQPHLYPSSSSVWTPVRAPVTQTSFPAPPQLPCNLLLCCRALTSKEGERGRRPPCTEPRQMIKEVHI